MTVKQNAQIDTDRRAERLGAELRSLRKAHGLTLRVLAEKSGKSISFISKIERGRARPSITALQDIAEALDVPIGWFFLNDGPVPAEERPYIVRAGHRRRRLTYFGGGLDRLYGLRGSFSSRPISTGSLALGMSRYEPGGTTGDDALLPPGRGGGAGPRGRDRADHRQDQCLQPRSAGDSFSFPATPACTRYQQRHGERTGGDLVWANTPVSLRP